ncbi:integrase [Silvibacterium bohemicum]|uniref:Integrase n=1 Tax=Silvibacterium bohemicum TaxID=1577686 RepID=A0A841K868_9BACT|nr:tyrosine-type recombinase/integrase [Silvibacterium bohemicum]MBB6147311.1 integrase [Silvibacterium bohemicum]
MLSPYTRHYPPCNQTDISYRRCRCPKWIQGTLPDGRYLRKTAKTRSWEKAETLCRRLEDESDPNKPEARPRAKIADAIKTFRDDEDARGLTDSTLQRSRYFFETQLKEWAKQEGLVYLDQLTPPLLTKFRSGWENAPQTMQRKHERMVSFFWFCVRMDWIQKNPAILLKRIKVATTPTDYFPKDEFKAIVDGTYSYGNWHGGHDFENRRDRLRALVLLMRWSGLAITDAVTLERTRLGEGGNLFLYRAKTGVPVYVPLPPDVVALLSSLPNSNPHYFFWSGNGKPETAKRGWVRSLTLLFGNVSIKNPDGTLKRCHSHMFRDTFAVELLLAGVPIDQVSLLLGHSSVKVTEKHYAPFVKARQEQLAQSARMAWEQTGKKRQVASVRPKKSIAVHAA